MASTDQVTEKTLDGMKEYYDARAAEYDEWFYRRGRYDHGEQARLRWEEDAQQVRDALHEFRLTGHVLELAPGTGIWTAELLKNAERITAIDASPRMIEMNRIRLRDDARVTYRQADLFQWLPTEQYDAVFFGFWLSHVPLERLCPFLQKIATALRAGGKVFFVDSRPDPTMSANNHTLPAEGSQIMKRLLNDGSSFDIVKNFFEPTVLEQLCADCGLSVTVRETERYFFYGVGCKKP